MSDITLLDCTLRDGGYYNNWNFSPSFVSAYLDSCVVSGIDIVELGFRFLSPTGFKGPYAFTSESFVSTLSLPSELKYAVMINACDFKSQDNINDLVDSLFPIDSDKSFISLVRIASHYRELSTAFLISSILKSKGYKVAVNLMQISLRSDTEILILLIVHPTLNSMLFILLIASAPSYLRTLLALSSLYVLIPT